MQGETVTDDLPVNPTREVVHQRRKEDSDKQWARWDKRIRDLFMFGVGIIGVCNELFVEDEPRVYALMFLATILGFPFVLNADEKRRDKEEK